MTKPKWLEKTEVKKKSRKKERQRATELGGTTQIGSGNQFYAQGDICLSDYLIEHKYTDKESYSLHKDTFNKIEKEAVAVGKLPAMIIEIQNRKLVVVRYDDI